MFSLSVIVLLGWGAFAFGAEYSWAYAPLLVFAVTVGVLGLLASWRWHTSLSLRALAVMLGAIVLAGSLQLVPLPGALVTAMSPGADAADYRQLYLTATMQPVDEGAGAAGSTGHRPLSVAPSRTLLGLTFLAAFSLLLVGCAHGFSALGVRAVARGVVVLAVAAALLGIIQKASGSDVVYGFWHQRQPQHVFAPFNNRNHFAGWMVMAASLAVGHFAGGLARGLRRVGPEWRQRVLWLSKPQASETLFTGFAVAIMAVSVVFTASRSGFLALLLTVIGIGIWTARRLPARRRRTVAAGYAVFVVTMAMTFGGIDAVGERLYATSPSDESRVPIWQDTLKIIEDFPVAGTGLNTFGISMLHYQTRVRNRLPIEAHSDYLQLAAEGGVLLGVPIVLAVVLFVREVWRRFRESRDDTATYWLRVGAVVGLSAMAVQETVDFTLQMPGAAVLFVVLAAIAIHRPDFLHAPRGAEADADW